jgi:hypothetical protein
MNTKSYRKYLLLKPESYAKLKTAAFFDDHLSVREKNVLNVLKNRKLTPRQRLGFVNQILFLKERQYQAQTPKLTQNENKAILKDEVREPLKDLKIPFSIFKKPLDENTSTHMKPTQDVNKNTLLKPKPSLKRVKPRRLNFAPDVNETSITIEDNADTSQHNLTQEELMKSFVPFDEEYFDSEDAPRNNQNEANDDINPYRTLPHDYKTFDRESFQNELQGAIEEAFGPVNLNSLRIRNVDNPDISMITIENQDGNTLSVEKPDEMIARQKKLTKTLSPSRTRRGKVLKPAEDIWVKY